MMFCFHKKYTLRYYNKHCALCFSSWVAFRKQDKTNSQVILRHLNHIHNSLESTLPSTHFKHLRMKHPKAFKNI